MILYLMTGAVIGLVVGAVATLAIVLYVIYEVDREIRKRK